MARATNLHHQRRNLRTSSSSPKRGRQHSRTLFVNMTLSLEVHRSKHQLLMRSSRWITLQVADELFPDCRRSGVFVNVIASNCCPYGEFRTHHFISRNATNEMLQGFAIRFNVSSRKSKYSSPSAILFIPILMVTK